MQNPASIMACPTSVNHEVQRPLPKMLQRSNIDESVGRRKRPGEASHQRASPARLANPADLAHHRAAQEGRPGRLPAHGPTGPKWPNPAARKARSCRDEPTGGQTVSRRRRRPPAAALVPFQAAKRRTTTALACPCGVTLTLSTESPLGTLASTTTANGHSGSGSS
jgi:hypothetical protein